MPTVLYGAETWGLRESERKKLNVFEMRCLRSMIGVTRRDRVRNTVIRERTSFRSMFYWERHAIDTLDIHY